MSTTLDMGITDVETLKERLEKVKQAQAIFSTFSQEKVDKIFKAAALAANAARIPLAKMAVTETGMGILEDKVIKNHYSAEYVYNAYKDAQTVGVIEEDKAAGIRKIAEPIGVIAAIIPTTNPTSTAIFKTLISLKTRNGVIIAPHPRAKECTAEATRIIYDAAVKAGAPKDIVAWISSPSVEMSNELMRSADLTLATGGPGMVKAAYSSGKPALGVGAGNVPAIFHKSSDIKTAVSSVILSKTFDNGVICASEQSVIVDSSIYEEVKKEFIYRGCHILSPSEIEKVRKTIIIDGGLNAKIVGQSAFTIAQLAGITVPETAKILIGEVESVEMSEEFAHEKLSPVLAMYKYDSFPEAITKAETLIRDGGYGHTASIYIDTLKHKDDLTTFEFAMKTGRILVNTPSAHGGIGDLYNFKLAPSLTLGCGSWGGNAVSENVGIKHLLNVKTVAERRENMLWFRAPEKVYFKKGSMPVAIKELKEIYNKKKVFIVTDHFLYQNDYLKPLYQELDAMGIAHYTFFDVEPDPTLDSAIAGAKAMESFEPDCIVAFGGGSPMDAGKIMWLLYEHPEVDFHDMAMRFMDIRKRVYTFPKMKVKADFVCIPTTAGTGSEVTPFAVITDNGVKYPIADYELMPTMAIVDCDFMMDMPKSLTVASGIDVMTHAFESYASMLSTEYTEGMALSAIKSVFKYLPIATHDGSNVEAREKMANASCIAGMSFANAFLGICHSLAHKLGATFHVPHGIANALLLNEVVKFNANDNPLKMGAFSQYKYPSAKARYAEIADFMGLGGKTDDDKVQKLVDRFTQLKKEVEVPLSIKDYGIKEADFLAAVDTMAEQAFDDQCTGANPVYPKIEELKQIYLRAYYGE